MKHATGLLLAAGFLFGLRAQAAAAPPAADVTLVKDGKPVMRLLAASCAALWVLCHRMFATGYKLKA